MGAAPSHSWPNASRGSRRRLYGSDAPFMPAASIPPSMAALAAFYDEGDLAALCSGNAHAVPSPRSVWSAGSCVVTRPVSSRPPPDAELHQVLADDELAVVALLAL